MLAEGKPDKPRAAEAAMDLATRREARLDPGARHLLAQWPELQRAYAGDELVTRARDQEIRTALTRTSLSGTRIRRVALPGYEDHGELLKWLLLDNVQGSFPFTAGVFPFRREGEDPTRMFAGEGDALPHQPALQAAQPGLAGQATEHGASTASRCTAPTPRRGPTSTARWATPA